MPGWLGILLFAAGIFVMILGHEAAHFAAARAFGIKIDEFFIGFGPRLWSTRRGETEYGIKALPLGGYVRIAGMNPFQEVAPEDRPRAFSSKPPWQRAVVLVVGSVTHFVLAFLVLVLFFGIIGTPTRFAPLIAEVQPSLGGAPSPAAVAGLKPGDEVLSVDGQPVRSVDGFVDLTRMRTGQPIVLVVDRDGHRVTIRATPRAATVRGRRVGRLGIVVAPGRVLARDRQGPIEAVGSAAAGVGRLTVRSFESLGRVFSPEGFRRIGALLLGKEERGTGDVVGVVGAARLSGQAFEAGFFDWFLLLFAGFNVFVGILNLLPLPPLDGGHLAVVGWEKVTGRRVDVRKLLPLTALVAGVLILLFISVTYLDVTSPIPNPFR